MSYIRWRWLPYLLSVFAVAILLHSDVLLRHFHDAPEKVGLLMSGPRTDLGDNYYYFTMLRHAPERMLPQAVRQGDPDGGDHRNINAVTNSYAAGLYAGYALYWIAAALTPTSRDAALVTSIFHTAVLAFCFTGFLVILLDGRFREGWFLLLVLSFVGLVFVDAFGDSVYFGRRYWENNLLTYYSNPTRLVNPTLFWAVGLAAAASIVRWIREERLLDLFGAIALACLTGLFSISVGATLVLALSLAIAFEAITKHIVRWRLMAIALAATAGLAWGYLQLRAYAATSLGQELRHGEFIGVVVKWQFLFLLALIPFVWRTLGKERVFVAALVVSAMIVGMFCESFLLGDRLWLRGAVVYAWAVTVFVMLRITLGWFASTEGVARRRMWGKGIAVGLMVVFVLQAQRADTDSWKGFVARDKWQLLDWIDAQLPAGSIVASGDIEDACLLPIYTRAKPLYAMYGLTTRTRNEELRRYFYNMKLFDRDRQLLTAVLSLKQEDATKYVNHVMGAIPRPYSGEVADALIFLELVVYHSYVRGMSNALTDPEQHLQLERLLRTRADEASRLSYSFDYAIVTNGSLLPAAFSTWTAIYRNGSYSVLKGPLAHEPRI